MAKDKTNIKFLFEDSALVGLYECEHCGESFWEGDGYTYCPYCGLEINEIANG